MNELSSCWPRHWAEEDDPLVKWQVGAHRYFYSHSGESPGEIIMPSSSADSFLIARDRSYGAIDVEIIRTAGFDILIWHEKAHEKMWARNWDPGSCICRSVSSSLIAARIISDADFWLAAMMLWLLYCYQRPVVYCALTPLLVFLIASRELCTKVRNDAISLDHAFEMPERKTWSYALIVYSAYCPIE
jgi:hypothetical protein